MGFEIVASSAFHGVHLPLGMKPNGIVYACPTLTLKKAERTRHGKKSNRAD